jgi:hypothetical protein
LLIQKKRKQTDEKKCLNWIDTKKNSSSSSVKNGQSDQYTYT